MIVRCPPSECAGHGNMEQQREGTVERGRERAGVKGDCNRTGTTAEN